MLEFSDRELRAFIGFISDRFQLGLELADREIRQHERFLEFRGRLLRMRKDKVFVIPVENRFPGIITARSVLYGNDGPKMSWLFNGQASRGCVEAVYISASSDRTASLHASKERLYAWTHGRLAHAQEDRRADWKRHFDETYAHHVATGMYGDEVGVGHFVADDSDYLRLRIEPLSTLENLRP